MVTHYSNAFEEDG